MTVRTIQTPDDLARLKALLDAQALPFTVSIAKGKNRSKQQNALLHKWMTQVASELGGDMLEYKAQAKLQYGLPIMHRDNPSWVEKYAPLYEPLDYARKLALFEFIPLTSKLRVKQMQEFMDAVQKQYLQMGIALIDPDAAKWEAFQR